MNKAIAKTDAAGEDTKRALQEQPREKLKIPVIPGESEQVEVCINGYWTVIRRGAEVEVPASVATVLRQAQII
ncbi:MAG: hypothetical protein ACOYU3_07130 [Bacillota bacterium]